MLSEQNEIKLIELFKTCIKCEIPKSLKMFDKAKHGRFGVKSNCKVCIKIYNKAYQEKNKNKIKAYYQAHKNKQSIYRKIYYKTHKDKVKASNKVYREANKDKQRLRCRAYYISNKEKEKLRGKIYREANRDKIKARRQIYRKIHKEKIKAYNEPHKKEKKISDAIYNKANRAKINIRTNIYRKKRRETDFKFKLARNISTSIWSSLKGNKNNKSWEKLTGYTIKQLKKYLKKHFKKGMAWENYGEWHIDHKIPINVFNFTKPDHTDFKKCWALSNLQPMWAEDNLSKGAKLEKHFQPSLMI